MSEKYKHSPVRDVMDGFDNLLELAEHMCKDNRELLVNLVTITMHQQYPFAMKMYTQRFYNFGDTALSQERTIEIMHGVMQFLELGVVVEMIFDELLKMKLLPRKIEPGDHTFAEYLRSVFVPIDLQMPRPSTTILEVLQSSSSPPAHPATRMLGSARRIAKSIIKSSGSSDPPPDVAVEKYFTKQYVRYRSAKTLDDMGDVFYDLGRMISLISLIGIHTVSVEHRASFLHLCGLLKQSEPLTPRQSGGTIVTDAAIISTNTRFLTVYYALVTDFTILFNSKLYTQYRVRAALRLTAQLSLLAFNYTCMYSVGELFGTVGRTACASVNLVFAFLYMFGNAKYRDDLKRIRSGEAYRTTSIDDDDDRNTRLMIFFLATVFAFVDDINKMSKKPMLLPDMRTGKTIDFEEFTMRMLQGRQTPTDMCNMIVVRIQACSLGRLDPISVNNGYGKLRNFISEKLVTRRTTATEDFKNYIEVCEDSERVLADLIAYKYSPNSYVDFIHSGTSLDKLT